MQQKVIAGVAVVALLLGGLSLFSPSEKVIERVVEKTVGAASGPTVTEPTEFIGGYAGGIFVATTTKGSLTLRAADIKNVSRMAMFPFIGDQTVTLPASSTLSTLLPLAGQKLNFCIYNATTTSGIDITFASGTGVDLEVASTTGSGPGGVILTLLADNTACFEIEKKGGPSGAANRDDFTARFTRYINGD